MEVVIGILVILLFIWMFSGSKKCDVCKSAINRKHHKWKIDGRKHKVCPHCNALMRRKASREAFDQKFSD